MSKNVKAVYENRELSWLKFNTRVFLEAKDKSLLPLERIKFISITSSNLDEFFMVRVASLKDLEEVDNKKTDIAGLSATEQLRLITEQAGKLVDSQYNCYMKSLVPLLKEEGIVIIDKPANLSAKQMEFVRDYFVEQVFPVLTPMAHDASRPFPLIRNKSLNIAAAIEAKEGAQSEDVEFATVQVPSVLPRLIPIPSEGEAKNTFILLEQMIIACIDLLFMGYKVKSTAAYRVMRNADFELDEDETSDLLAEIESKIKQRQRGDVIRLEIDDSCHKNLLGYLMENLDVKEEDVYKISGPVDLTFLMKLYGIEGYDHLRSKSYTPQKHPRFMDETESIFDVIKKGDVLLHHPYETFDPVVNFIAEAANDKNVLAIKQTLYRVSGNSPIIASLAKAAENGKQVTVLVELKARFDEENNINWARKLEKAGCHVIYGLVGLKTHCKIALVVRREEDEIVRYVHLGTGNYNDSTAKLYTDCGLLSCRESLGIDATAVFNMLSGYSKPQAWKKLAVAPYWLRDKFYELIDFEIEEAKKGNKAKIVAKMNSLCDKGMIDKLYQASQAGVKISLIIRGICCLKAGIPGLSENIEVRSIVGTYLEHARIFYFYAGGEEKYFCGSADWMNRNLDRRVEIVFPVEDQEAKEKLKHILKVQLSDNMKAYILDEQGNYDRVDLRGKEKVLAQDVFCEEAQAAAKAGKEKDMSDVQRFIPIQSQ